MDEITVGELNYMKHAVSFGLQKLIIQCNR